MTTPVAPVLPAPYYDDGQITLYCGDSLGLMAAQGIKPNHIITDPPYEASLHESKNNQRKGIRCDGRAELRGVEFDPIDSIRKQIIDLSYPICSGWFVAFCTVEGTGKWADVINPSPMKYKRACIWVKPDSTPQLNGQSPAQGAECFVTAWCGEGHSRWNSGGKRGVYTHLTNNRDRHGEHPTEKPVSLMREIILDFTRPGDLVMDLFMGSGTTGIACVQTGRRFVGVELDPRYFEIAHSRIREAQMQGQLFSHPAPKPVQELMVLTL